MNVITPPHPTPPEMTHMHFVHAGFYPRAWFELRGPYLLSIGSSPCGENNKIKEEFLIYTACEKTLYIRKPAKKRMPQQSLDRTPVHTAEDIRKAFSNALSLVMATLHSKFSTGHSGSAEYTTTKKATLLFLGSFGFSGELAGVFDPSKELAKVRSARDTHEETKAMGNQIEIDIEMVNHIYIYVYIHIHTYIYRYIYIYIYSVEGPHSQFSIPLEDQQRY